MQEVHMTTFSNSRHFDEPLGSGVSPHREWLSYAEASELVGLGRTTLWKLAGAGEIKVARVGRAVRISRESLTTYMKRSAEGGAVADGVVAKYAGRVKRRTVHLPLDSRL
jgi:excisionase family DNA binding protein